MKLAAHIKEARKRGTQAGFNTWYDYLVQVTNDGQNGLPQVQDMLAEVRKAGKYSKRAGEFRNPEKALAWYCNHYANELGDTPTVVESKTRTKRSTTRKAQAAPAAATTEPQIDSNILAQLAQALGLNLDATATTDEDDDEDDDTETIQGVRTRRVQRTRTVEAEGDTGVASYPPPRDPDAPATQGKLWKLNHDGPAVGLFVCVIDGDGNILAGGDDPITAGEAYDLISEHIAQ
jgi:hypothetical protein